MHITRPRFIRRYDFADFERYITHDGRFVLAGAIGHDTIGEARYHIKSSVATAATPRPFVALELTHGADNIDAWKATKIARDFSSRVGIQRAIYAVHGPPAEPVHLHIHLVGERPSRNGKLVKEHDFKATCYRAVRELAPTWDLEVDSLAEPGPPINYRAAYRGDDFTLHEWILATPLMDEIQAVHDARAFHGILASYGLRYKQTPRGGSALVDEQTGVAVRASAFGLARSQLPFAWEDAPLLLPLSERHYANERHQKFEPATVAAHAQARTDWSASVEPLLEEEKREIRSTRDALTKGVKARILALREEIQEVPKALRAEARDAAELVADRCYGYARQWASDAIRRAEWKHPPRPAARIGDWLNQRRPEPPATFRPKRARAQMPAEDRYFDGVRYAVDEGDRVHLLLADPPPEILERLPFFEHNLTVRHAEADVALAPLALAAGADIERDYGEQRAREIDATRTRARRITAAAVREREQRTRRRR